VLDASLPAMLPATVVVGLDAMALSEDGVLYSSFVTIGVSSCAAIVLLWKCGVLEVLELPNCEVAAVVASENLVLEVTGLIGSWTASLDGGEA
jgi:hypothetical protein